MTNEDNENLNRMVTNIIDFLEKQHTCEDKEKNPIFIR